MIELVIACFIGILIGTTTGMIPGIHVNTAGAILFASSTFLLTFLSPEFLCVLMVAMSIAHALIEFGNKQDTLRAKSNNIIVYK